MPLTHVSSGRFVSENSFLHSRRNLDTYVLLIGLEGNLFIQEEDTQYVLEPGSMLLLSPYMTHFGYKESAGLSYYWCHFTCPEDSVSYVKDKEAANMIYLLKNQFQLPEMYNELLIPKFYKLPNDCRVNILFNQLLHNTNNKYYTDRSADYLLTLIAMEITQQAINDFNQNDFKDNSRFIEVMEWIRINIHQPLTVREISERFNYNPDYLSSLVRRKTGLSLLQYINKSKIEKAKKMLILTNASIKEISYNLGFQDIKYFMKLFKCHENLTPSQYRNAYCLTHLNNK